jgi:crossover junction endodeoxyribonuclease RusA
MTTQPTQARESSNTCPDWQEHQSEGSEPTEGHTAVFELWIPQPAGWINSNHRPHWAQRAKLTKAWRQAGLMYARQAKLPTGLERVRIEAHVVKSTAREYDAHNLMPTGKAIMDGLVDYGLVPDDKNKHVVGPDMREGGKGLPGILVKITELVIDAY